MFLNQINDLMKAWKHVLLIFMLGGRHELVEVVNHKFNFYPGE